MAGSRKDVNYVADDGTTYAINVDEGNVELIMGAQIVATPVAVRKPSNLKQLRSVELSDESGTIKRIVPVLTQARYNALNGTSSFTLDTFDSANGVVVGVSRKIPEKFTRIPRSVDTGLNDGDKP